jgi:hypothetical protein
MRRVASAHAVVSAAVIELVKVFYAQSFNVYECLRGAADVGNLGVKWHEEI